jgi:hypothetical protein
MARPRKQIDVTPAQAQYILRHLHASGLITVAHIREYLADLGREIHSLEQRLMHLRRAQDPADRGRNEPPTKRTSEGASRRPRARSVGAQGKRAFTVTEKVLKSRELQGRYLPLLNKFSGRRRIGFARLAKEKGREVAIAEMQAALRRRR